MNLCFDIRNGCTSVFLALLAAVGLIFYNKAVIAQGTESYVAIALASVKALASLKVLLVVAVFALMIYVCITQGEKVSKFIFKYRFLLCAIVFAVLVGFGISGSSIGMWSSVTGEDQTGLLAGISRGVRSDEWTKSTPMALSQYADPTGAFQYFSNVSRGTSTDVFLEYGQPVLDIVEIFRPFHLGYLFLPPAQGLSFCWCGRVIALFIVSFEFGRLITDDNRSLSLIYACLITLAPSVQWWFATGGITELLIFAQLATVMFKQFLLANDEPAKRIISLGVICICVGGYALTLYPPWQIPIAFVILALEMWVFLTYRKTSKFNRRDAIGCSCCIAVFVLIFVRVFVLSSDTIVSIMNTAYPGDRVSHGGGEGLSLFNYCASVFYPFNETGIPRNVCDASTFVDFFPLSVILPLYLILIKKNKDKLLMFLLVVVIFFDVYLIVGYPAIIEKLTLLNKCPAYRVAAVIGFPNIILLIRSLSMFKINKKVKTAVISLAFGVVSCFLVKFAMPEYVGIKHCISVLVIFSIFVFLLLNHSSFKKVSVTMLVTLMFIAGGLVNPVQKELDCIYENKAYQLVKEVHDSDPFAVWVTQGTQVAGDFLIMTGAPTVNSTNVYPNLERWHTIDPDRSNESIYNRFAHIYVDLKTTGSAEFSLTFFDAFSVSLTPEDAKQIGIKYVFTTTDLTEKLGFDAARLVSSSGIFKVYELL